MAATRANAERNGLADRVTAGRAAGHLQRRRANIGQDVLMALAADIEHRLRPGGWLGLSGISPAQVSVLAAAFRSLQVVATPQLDDWAAIVGEVPGE